MKLYYLGPRGTFSEEAALYFAHGLQIEGTDVVEAETIAKVIENVYSAAKSRADETILGCVPLENSIQGSVTMAWDTLGRFCRDEQANNQGLDSQPVASKWPSSPTIVASCTLSIDHFLMTLPQTLHLDEIREVLSHPQGLAQCGDWLHEHLPNARQTAVSSTADAARVVAEAGEQHRAAIGPKAAGRLYNLKLSTAPIQNSSLNQTRFGLVALNGRQPDVRNWATQGQWTLAIVLVGVANAPGGLFRTLQPFHEQAFNLTRIESRPVGSHLGEYLFFLDVEWPYEYQLPEATDAWIHVEEELRRSSVQVVRLGLFPEVELT